MSEAEEFINAWDGYEPEVSKPMSNQGSISNKIDEVFRKYGFQSDYMPELKQSILPLIESEVRKARKILQKEVKALVVNDLEAVRAKNKHLDSRLYEHTVSEAGGYIKAIEDVLDRINQLTEASKKEKINE